MLKIQSNTNVNNNIDNLIQTLNSNLINSGGGGNNLISGGGGNNSSGELLPSFINGMDATKNIGNTNNSNIFNLTTDSTSSSINNNSLLNNISMLNNPILNNSSLNSSNIISPCNNMANNTITALNPLLNNKNSNINTNTLSLDENKNLLLQQSHLSLLLNNKSLQQLYKKTLGLNGLGLLPSVDSNIEKTARELYVGNIPQHIDVQQLVTFLNTCLLILYNKDNENEQICLKACIRGDTHYAFVEFKTIQDTSNCMLLNGINFYGYNLRIGRPKTFPVEYTNLIPAATIPTIDNYYLSQGLLGIKAFCIFFQNQENTKNDYIPMNMIKLQKLCVSNIAINNEIGKIKELLEAFGEVNNFEFFEGEENSDTYICLVEYSNAENAIQAHKILNQNTSYKIKFEYEIINDPTINKLIKKKYMKLQNSILAQQIPTKVVVLSKIATYEELSDPNEYKDIIEDIRIECERYGVIVELILPVFARETYDYLKKIEYGEIILGKLDYNKQSIHLPTDGKNINNVASEKNVAANKLEVVDKESNVVDKESNMVDKESNMVDKESNMVDKESNMVDKESNMVDKESNMVDKESNMVDKESSVLDKESNMVDKESSVLDKESGVTNEDMKTHPNYDLSSIGCAFIYFENIEAATKARKQLSGRKFGANIIEANYYSEKKFLMKNFKNVKYNYKKSHSSLFNINLKLGNFVYSEVDSSEEETLQEVILKEDIANELKE
uniref:Uncharacterized LOC113222330 n=1 Tax=Piliocolobus tephrosceles TaxID=591936 RepID=A0A8C9HT46_9PRIM